jgi:hypothetical protein
VDLLHIIFNIIFISLYHVCMQRLERTERGSLLHVAEKPFSCQVSFEKGIERRKGKSVAHRMEVLLGK